jgi:putative NADH-flavin reductase
MKNLLIAEANVESDNIAHLCVGAYVVISAYGPPNVDTDRIVGVTEKVLQAVKDSGAKRFIGVG